MRQVIALIVETNRCNGISKIHCSMVILQKNKNFYDFLRYLTHHKTHANLQQHLTHANLQQHLLYFVHLHTGDVCGGMRAKIRRAGVADSRVVCDESNNVETS